MQGDNKLLVFGQSCLIDKSGLPIARREEDSSPVIASPAGAKQSHEKRLRLPRRYAPRNGHNTKKVLLAILVFLLE